MNSLRININNVYVMFAMLFPIIPIYFDIFGINFTNIFCGLFILFVLCRKWQIPKLRIRDLGIITTLLAWFVWQEFSNLYFAYYADVITFAVRMFAGVLLIQVINSGRLFRRIIFGMTYATGIVCILGVIEGITGFSIWSLLNTSGVQISINDLRFGMQRIVGFTFQTITYCTYLMMAGAIVFYALTLSADNKKQRSVIKGIYILLWINVILTFSRSAMIGFMVIQLLLVWKCGFVNLIKRLLIIFPVGVVGGVIIGVVFPGVMEMLVNVFYMIFAVFDDNYTSTIASSFGNDNLNAIGNRIDLYDWVWATVKDDLLMGFGGKTNFTYDFQATDGRFAWIATKVGSEVHWLYVLFHYGMPGLIIEVLAFIAIVLKAVKENFKPLTWENKLNFNFVICVTFLMIALQYFAVNGSSERHMLYLLVFLFLAYNFKVKREDRIMDPGNKSRNSR